MQNLKRKIWNAHFGTSGSTMVLSKADSSCLCAWQFVQAAKIFLNYPLGLLENDKTFCVPSPAVPQRRVAKGHPLSNQQFWHEICHESRTSFCAPSESWPVLFTFLCHFLFFPVPLPPSELIPPLPMSFLTSVQVAEPTGSQGQQEAGSGNQMRRGKSSHVGSSTFFQPQEKQ